MEAVEEELIDDGEQGPSSIGHDLGWIAMHTKRSLEEPSRGRRVAPRRDEYVDDLTVLVDSPVDVAPRASDLHIRLVHKPTIADRVAAWSGRISEEWRETLYPAEHRDVIDLDPAFGE